MLLPLRMSASVPHAWNELTSWTCHAVLPWICPWMKVLAVARSQPGALGCRKAGTPMSPARALHREGFPLPQGLT